VKWVSQWPKGPSKAAEAEKVRALGGLHVIDDVSFSCRAGIVKAIIGPNGAGKTTLFNLIAGSIVPAEGSIVLDGRQTAGLPPHRVAALGISRTFQATRLFPGMSVLENVTIAALLHTSRTAEAEAVALECIEMTGLKSSMDLKSASLPESAADDLHPWVRGKFLELWQLAQVADPF